jgi:hypothetical protein
MGPGAVLADVNPAARELANEIAAKDITISLTMEKNLTARGEQYEPNLRQALERAIGPDFNEVDCLNNLFKAQTQAHAEAGYGPFRNQRVSMDVSDITNPIDTMALRKGLRGAVLDPDEEAIINMRKFLPTDPSNVTIQEMDSAIKNIHDAKSEAYSNGQPGFRSEVQRA